MRPKALRDAFRTYGAEVWPNPQFAAVQEQAIRDAVKLQEEAGLQVVDRRRVSPQLLLGSLRRALPGFVIKPAVFKFRDDNGHEVDSTATSHQNAQLARTQPLATDEFEFLRSVTKATGKITMPAPSTMHFYRCTDFANPAVYADAATFLPILPHIYREEIADLAKAATYVQLDEVAVAMLQSGNPGESGGSQPTPIPWLTSTSRRSTTPSPAHRATC